MPRRNHTLPHQPFRHATKCAQKRRFISEKSALQAAEEQMLLKPELNLKVYKCSLCSGWHLTRDHDHKIN